MNYPPKPIKAQGAIDTDSSRQRRWFDSFVIGSIDPILVFDENLLIKFVNQNAAKLLGMRVNELIGKSIENCNALGSIIAPTLHEVMKSRTGTSCDHEIPDGETFRTFQGSYSPVLNGNHRPLGIFSVLREVTDRRDMLQRLVASNKRLATQARAMEVFDIVSESDLSGEILYVNDQFCKTTQYSRGELIGKTYRKINSGTHTKVFFRELWETIGRGQPWLGEIKNRSKDGSTFWVKSIITPTFNEQGNITRILSIQQDITTEHNERFRVAGSALRFRQLLDSSPVMEASLDLDHNIVFCNSALLNATGYTESEIAEKKWVDVFTPFEEKQRFQMNLLRLLSGSEVVIEFSFALLAKDGSAKGISWRASAIHNLEEITYGIHLMGEEKRPDKVATDHLRRDMIGFVSHELKAGLISVRSGLRLIQDHLDNPGLDRRYLNSTIHKILSKASRLGELSQNMMSNLDEASRPSQLHTQAVSLRTILSGIWPRFQEESPSAKTFAFDLQIPGTDITVEWDPFKIEQLLRNLLSNAIQYSKPGGGAITLFSRRERDNILIGVSDDGIGIHPESVETMFNLFTRGVNTEQRHPQHFGIGLKLCKDIASLHRGRIWIESKPGFGTTVFLLLPISHKNHSPLLTMVE